MFATQEATHHLGRNEEFHPVPGRGFRRGTVHGSPKNEAILKSMYKVEEER